VTESSEGAHKRGYYVAYAKPDGTLALLAFDSLDAAGEYALAHPLGSLVLEVRGSKVAVRDVMKPAL
jgi:hypothetical protein